MSGTRTVNPCAHVIFILIFIHACHINTTHSLSLIVQKLRDSIMDCKVYKDWAKREDIFCVCQQKLDKTSEHYIVHCSFCDHFSINGITMSVLV